MRRRFFRNLVISAVAITALALGILAYHFHHNSDILWNVISRQCLPHQQQRHDPAPCQQVDLVQRYVLLKDKVGPLQYLLLPTDKISGIESPELLAENTPDYFAIAWSHLDILSQRLGTTIPLTDLSLAINSQHGRTQNQLHIHMSCLKPDVKHQLEAQQAKLTANWQPLTLLGHSYWVRSMERQQLSHPSLFIRISQELPDIDLEKGGVGIALAQLPNGRLVVMVLRTDWLKGVLGSAEELQDHRCQRLEKNIAA